MFFQELHDNDSSAAVMTIAKNLKPRVIIITIKDRNLGLSVSTFRFSILTVSKVQASVPGASNKLGE